MTNMSDGKQVIIQDRWDTEDYAQAKATVDSIPKTEERLADALWTGSKLLSDVYASLVKSRPELADDVQPAFRPNRQVMSEVMDAQPWRDLREFTVGDQFTAGLAVTKMADDLVDMLTRMADAQEKADDHQQKADDYENACQEGGVAPDSDGAEAIPDLRDLRVARDQAAQAADQALDRVTPQIGQIARKATQEAAEEASEAAAAAGGWGLEPGELSKMDPKDRMALAARLGTDRMRKISELFGRLRNESWAVETNRFDAGPDEIADITLSDDVGRLIGSELVLLADDDLNIEFLDRYTRRQLLTYETRSVRREARGGIIYVEDGSSSMHGTAEFWARAVGLALLDIAARQGRPFHVILFSGKGSIQEFSFGDKDASTVTLEQRLAYAETHYTGGTDFEGPLTQAMTLLDAEFEATGRTTGDIVFATDGEAGVSAGWLQQWDEFRARLGFRCFGLSIAQGTSPELARLCDRVAEVHRLTDGSEISDLFAAVSERKEATL